MRSLTKVICPRCHKEGVLEEFRVYGRRYLRVVHYYYDEDGRREKKRCYIGPADDYDHVNRLHRLEVTNLKDVDPAIIIENAVRNYISMAEAVLMRKNTERADVSKIIESTLRIYTTLERCKRMLQELVEEIRSERRER